MAQPGLTILTLPIRAHEPIRVRLYSKDGKPISGSLTASVGGTAVNFRFRGGASALSHAVSTYVPMTGDVTDWGDASPGTLVRLTFTAGGASSHDESRVQGGAVTLTAVQHRQTRSRADRSGRYKSEGMGWLPDPPDARDLNLRSARVRDRLGQLGASLGRGVSGTSRGLHSHAGQVLVDLRQWCSPIEDQGQIGSCTAQAVVGALEYLQRKLGADHVDASRLFLYRVTRRFLGWEHLGDTGAFLRSTMKALRLFGSPPERYWPYVEAAWDDEPDAFAYAFAQNFKSLEYFRLDTDVVQLKSCLDSGLPFAFGFSCFESLDAPEVTATGLIPYPLARERNTGGHAVLAVGYTQSHVIIRNSWGAAWGDDGYGYLPWSYFDPVAPLASDCWALVNAAWVPHDEADHDVALSTLGASKRLLRVPVAEAARPSYIAARHGDDPLRRLPLMLSKGHLVAQNAGQLVPQSRTALGVTVSLTEITLRESFDFALFGEATNEVYVHAIAWDLSGDSAFIWPAKEVADLAGHCRMQKGDVWRFLGSGLALWPNKPVVGALYVRLVLMESDDSSGAIETLDALQDAVALAKLDEALGALAAGPEAATLAAIGAAASALNVFVVAALKGNRDDVVALFEGSWTTPHLAEAQRSVYSQRGAEIVLEIAPDPTP